MGAPNQGADPRAQLAVGGDQTNILPLDLTLFLKLNLLILSCSHSITDQYIERASSSRSVAIRLNSYNAPLYFEIDSQLGPYCPEIIGFPLNPCLAYPVCPILLELCVLHVLNKVALVVSSLNAQLNHLPLQHVATTLQHHLPETIPP